MSATPIRRALDAFLQSRATPPTLLALGEPTHGDETYLNLRNEAFEHLVERHGYRSIALEISCLASLRTDAYVQGGPGTLDEVMTDGFSHGWGSFAGSRELVRWTRDHNQRRTEDPVHFYGFDAPTETMGADSPRLALTALHRYLAAHLAPAQVPSTAASIDELVGADARWTNQMATFDPRRSVGASPEVATLRILADDLRTALASNTPALIAASSAEEWWEAALHARAAALLLRYHTATADTSTDRMERLCQLRDTMMAENLCAIRHREERRGPTLVFAHNSHLQRQRSQMPMGGQVLTWWSGGAIAAAHLGDRYAVGRLDPAHGALFEED